MMVKSDIGKTSLKFLHVIFITEFILLIKTPLFYEVNSFNRKWLAHERISKMFFLDHFSSLFLGQKYYILSHIQF